MTRVSLETRSTLAQPPKLPFKAATCHFRLIVRTKCATHSLTLDHTRSSAPSRASHLWRTRNSPHSLRFGESQPSVQRSRHTRPAFARRGDFLRGHTRHTRCPAGKKAVALFADQKLATLAPQPSETNGLPQRCRHSCSAARPRRAVIQEDRQLSPL